MRSKRGVGGGYVLARDPEEIKLSEIVSAVDGPITLGDFGQPHQDGACDHEGQCVLIAVWNVAGEFMRRHLESYTLAAVARMAKGDAPWPSLDDASADRGRHRLTRSRRHGSAGRLERGRGTSPGRPAAGS